MVEEVYEEYTNEIERHMSKIPSLSSDWEEFKSHVYGFVVDVASETNTKAALLSAVKKEFGTPEEVRNSGKTLN